MNWLPISVFFLISVLLLVSGLMIRLKKAYNLIAGYNTMTETKKAKIDKEKMGRMVSLLLFLLAALFATAGVLFLLGNDTAGSAAMLFVLPLSLFFIILMQKTFQPDAANRKKAIRTVNWLAVFFVIVAVSVTGLIYTNSKPNGFTVENGSLVITGAYGETVPLSTVSEISVEKSLPAGLQKENGFDWESVLKGSFRSGSNRVTLYVDTKAAAFLRLKTPDGEIYISTGSAAQTQALYEHICAAGALRCSLPKS